MLFGVLGIELFLMVFVLKRKMYLGISSLESNVEVKRSGKS